MSTYQYHPGNLHDPNVMVEVRWACGHTTAAWFSKLGGVKKGDVIYGARCAQCVLDPIVPKPGSGEEPLSVDGPQSDPKIL